MSSLFYLFQPRLQVVDTNYEEIKAHKDKWILNTYQTSVTKSWHARPLPVDESHEIVTRATFTQRRVSRIRDTLL